ncbi:hypothetical protein AAMO2058_001478800 [Amorphochlora amoebiformis]
MSEAVEYETKGSSVEGNFAEIPIAEPIEPTSGAPAEPEEGNIKAESEPGSADGEIDAKANELKQVYLSLNHLSTGGVVQKGHHVSGVEVSDPQTSKSLTSSYTTYAVTVQPNLEDVKFVRRRYSDFVWLRKWLTEGFPGIFIPPLPPKSIFNKMRADFIEERRQGLQEFMKRLISRQQFLIHSLPFQLFISKHSNTFEKTKREVEKTIIGQSPLEIATMYQTLFPNMSGSKVKASEPKNTPQYLNVSSADEKMVRLKDYLTSCGTQVQVLYEAATQIASKWNDIVSNSSKVTGSFKSLSKVENGYAQRPAPPRMDVVGKFSSWAGTIEQKPNQWMTITSRVFKKEKLDIDAMLDVVNKWESIQKRRAKAKDKVSRYASASELTAKNKAAKQKDEENLKAINALYDMVTKIIFNTEIVHYWNNRTRNFNHEVHKFFKKQLKISAQLAEVWSEQKQA